MKWYLAVAVAIVLGLGLFCGDPALSNRAGDARRQGTLSAFSYQLSALLALAES